MRLFITGTSGFVGGALGRFARANGHHVTGLSRRDPRVGAVDVALRHDLSRPLDWRGEVDVVIHAAALSSPWGRPSAYHDANVRGTEMALAIAREAGARFVLISSSSVLYAAGDQLMLPEEPAPDSPPVNDYARTKREAEQRVIGSGLPWAILRPRAVFGVGDTVLFPRIARAARLRMLPRFASTPPAIGDLVSIDNLVRRSLRAAEIGAEGIFHLIDPERVHIDSFVGDAVSRVGLPGPSWTVRPNTANLLARMLEGLSRQTGWWEPPITRYGVDVFTNSRTFDDRRARAVLGPPEISTGTALDRFADWWRAGAGLTHPGMGRVGMVP